MAADAPAIRNPIIPGFNPDPSCIYVDGTFYLVTSSFLFFPGLPIYTSKDLKTWTQIGNAINRPEQLDYTEGRTRPGTQFTGGIWAPTLRHRAGTFYVVTTFVHTHKDWDDYSRWTNVIFSTTDIHANAWSDAVHFEFPGYDTSLCWDDDGKAYITGSFYWRIRPELQLFEIDLQTGKSLSGEPRAIWSGMGGMAPEAPHIYQKDGKYYLLIAEGATEFGHCATMASAPAIWGPYTPCPTNPVLRAASPTSLFQTVGHADLFADGAGRWWAVALASRVVGAGRPIGRETVLLPVDWRGAWPVVDHSAIDVPVERLTRAPRVDGPVEDVLGELRHHLLHLRAPAPGTVRFPRAGTVLLAPQTRVPLTAPLGAPAFVGVRQRHLHFVCEAELALPHSGAGTAGLAVYLDHERSYAACADGRAVRFARVQPGAAVDEGGVDIGDAVSVHLRVVGTPDKYVFEYKPAAEGKWETIGEGATSGVSGGFTGTIIAVYAVLGEGDDGGSFEVEVKNWRYWATAEEW